MYLHERAIYIAQVGVYLHNGAILQRTWELEEGAA